MKAILEFNLPEDHEDYELLNNALNMSLALDEIRQYLRGQWKYQDPPDDIDKIYDRFFEICLEHKVEV